MWTNQLDCLYQLVVRYGLHFGSRRRINKQQVREPYQIEAGKCGPINSIACTNWS